MSSGGVINKTVCAIHGGEDGKGKSWKSPCIRIEQLHAGMVVHLQRDKGCGWVGKHFGRIYRACWAVWAGMEHGDLRSLGLGIQLPRRGVLC